MRDPRVDGMTPLLPVSAVVVTTIFMSPTAMTTGGTAIVVTPDVTRIHVHHWPARCRSVNYSRRAIRHRGRAVNYRRQTTRRGHHDRGRERHRQPERKVQRPTRVRRGGEPSQSDSGNQTEDIFCLHKRFDDLFILFFSGQKGWKVAGCKSVSEKEAENE